MFAVPLHKGTPSQVQPPRAVVEFGISHGFAGRLGVVQDGDGGHRIDALGTPQTYHRNHPIEETVVQACFRRLGHSPAEKPRTWTVDKAQEASESQMGK